MIEVHIICRHMLGFFKMDKIKSMLLLEQTKGQYGINLPEIPEEIALVRLQQNEITSIPKSNCSFTSWRPLRNWSLNSSDPSHRPSGLTAVCPPATHLTGYYSDLHTSQGMDALTLIKMAPPPGLCFQVMFYFMTFTVS